MTTHELWASPQSIIEKGGVDSETWFELRRLFEAMPEREDIPANTRNHTEREADERQT